MLFCKSNVKFDLLRFQIWSAKLQNFHAPKIKALLSGTELSYIYLSMLLNIALKFPIIPRPRPAFPTVITAKYIFLSELRKRKNKQKTFVSMKTCFFYFLMVFFLARTEGNKDEEFAFMDNFFCKSDLSIRVNKIFA